MSDGPKTGTISGLRDIALTIVARLREAGFTSAESIAVTPKRELMEKTGILCYEEEIVDIDAIRKKVEPQMENLLRNYSVIMDCTSSTKPATIAYYQLAETYLILLIYVYEETRQLRWPSPSV